MDLQELGMTALRTAIIYVFVLIVVRVMGKREVGNFSAFDLIVAFIISEVVDEPIYGDVPMVQALLVITLVSALHMLNSFLSYKSITFDKLTGGEPRVLVKDGEMDRKAMAAERINEEELWTMLRENKIDEDELKDVKRGTLETNGQLSVIKAEEAKELQKGDIKQRAQSSKKKGS